jgi:hypothetical protein
VERPETWEPILDGAIIEMERCLDFELSCRLHVVVFSTNREARLHLDRAIPSNMLLAPVLGAEDSVVAVQSAEADAANGDCERMRRHLCHEIAHVVVILRTGSEKRLGDGDCGLKVAAWVNEGFAVCAAAIATQQFGPIERARARAEQYGATVSNLDHAVNDLTGERRPAAMAVATMRIWKTIQVHGLRPTFARLTELSASSASAPSPP